MKTFFLELKFVVSSIIFIPHLFLYYFSKNKNVIDEDLIAMKRSPRYCSRNKTLLLFLLVDDVYFRKLFYTRVGPLSILVRWYSPGSDTFFPIKQIGGGVYLAHPYSTTLHAKSIGRNFSCRQCTTIGNKSDFKNDEKPTICDNVVLGANVVIIGDIRVGNNVIVGAGSVVVKDVPDNSIVAGNPAKIIGNIK